MMNDRYEIRDKLGQGGLGAIYLAYDRILHREVAIKRIIPNDPQGANPETSNQLAKEAGALSALQHPHIVTIFDVGVDQEGPFVVMELLQGKTVDDVVESAIFTWEDFREFALQTQEALIAAQDLNMVHRDLKPTNIMLTWLPSGKFQVKIVDFGLAKYTPKPSLQTTDQTDSIFGSIFFMAPEQFERVELDARTDMYALGCVYYYALTGLYPFGGDTGPQVMASHLHHQVYPLHEIRPDLPRWVSDWIMWHINRLPEHRPAQARHALEVFLQNVQHTDANPLQSIHSPAAPSDRPPAPLTSLLKTSPQRILPPERGGRSNIPTGPLIASESTTSPQENADALSALDSPHSTDDSVANTMSDPQNPPARPRLIVPGAPAQTTPLASPAANRPRLVVPGATPAPTPEKIPIAIALTPKQAPAAVALDETPQIPVAEIPVAHAISQPAIFPVAPIPSASTAMPEGFRPVVEETVAASAAEPTAQPFAAPPVVVSPPPVVATPTVKATPTIIAPARHVASPVARPAPSLNSTTTIAAPTSVPVSSAAVAAIPRPAVAKKKRMSNSAKAVLATVLGLLVIVIAAVLISTNAKSKINKRYNALVELAALSNTKELPVTSKDLEILMNSATSLAASSSRETVYKALYIAESADGSNLDATLVNYTLQTPMNEDIRVNLLSRVIAGRIKRGHADESTAAALIAFIKSNPKPASAAAAVGALREMATDTHFPDLLQLLQFAGDANIRKACEEVVVQIVKKSSNRSTLEQNVEPAFATASSPEVKQALLRVLGATGTPKAKEIILAQLQGNDKALQIAAADASKHWPDDSLLEDIISALSTTEDLALRRRLFHASREFLVSESKRSDERNQALWQSLANAAKGEEEQVAVISSLVMNSNTNKTSWAPEIIRKYEQSSQIDRVVDMAGKALNRLQEKNQQ